MKPSVTHKQVAQSLGISAGMVGRALRNDAAYSVETRERIQRAAREMGYDSNANLDARNLVGRRTGKRALTGTIAVAGMNMSAESDYCSYTLHGIQQALNGTGIDVMVLPVHDVPRWEKIDGLLGFSAESIETVNSRPPLVPAVTLFRPAPGLPMVAADDREAGYLAAKHLLNLGHTRIGCLLWPTVTESVWRLQGCRDALAEAGIAMPEEWVRPLHFTVGNSDYYGQNVREWLETSWFPDGLTALIAQNDAFAAQAMHAFQDAGLRVPEDVSVVGFDGTVLGRMTRPHLTSVRFPFEDMGRRAMELLLGQLGGEEAREGCELFPVQLTERASTAGPGYGVIRQKEISGVMS